MTLTSGKTVSDYPISQGSAVHALFQVDFEESEPAAVATTLCFRTTSGDIVNIDVNRNATANVCPVESFFFFVIPLVEVLGVGTVKKGGNLSCPFVYTLPSHGVIATRLWVLAAVIRGPASSPAALLAAPRWGGARRPGHSNGPDDGISAEAVVLLSSGESAPSNLCLIFLGPVRRRHDWAGREETGGRAGG